MVDGENILMPINILVADDHELIFDGIKSMLLDQEIIQSLDYCSSIPQLKSMLIAKDYHVLVLDININGKNTLDIISDIKAISPKIKIVILTSYENSKFYQLAKELNLEGYLLKNSNKKTFIEALQNVVNGKSYYQEFNKPFKTEFTDTVDSFGSINSLSKREKEMVLFITQGYNEYEISEKLFISRNTVRTHKKNIFKKLNIHGVLDLIKLVNGYMV